MQSLKIDETNPENGWSALFYAISAGKLEFVKLLHRCGAADIPELKESVEEWHNNLKLA